MNLKSTSLLGIKITISSKEDTLKYIKKYLKSGARKGSLRDLPGINTCLIFTPNPEIIEFSRNNKGYRETVNTGQINIPDGWGVTWGLKWTKNLKINKIPGVDLMQDLAGLAGELGFGVGLIGGGQGVAVNTAECLGKAYPEIKVTVIDSPFFNMRGNDLFIGNKSANRFIRKTAIWIAGENIRILFVAYGFPKQEMLAKRIKSELDKMKLKEGIVIMTVGGAFDYISGKAKRPPLFIRNINLEWLWRLIFEPGRFIRQARGGKFFLRVFLQNDIDG